MEDLLAFLNTLKSMSPLSIIALLGVVIWMLVKNQKGQEAIATNHLHDMPEMVDLLRAQADALRRIEIALAHISARINGRS